MFTSNVSRRTLQITQSGFLKELDLYWIYRLNRFKSQETYMALIFKSITFDNKP